mmetsp:Transcript_22062/g.47347  ORF Transcript_22062/g.47347 Transcript_22062/m.47347 type:complete len:210 (-) Transcript_22062:625-1254(-)
MRHRRLRQPRPARRHLRHPRRQEEAVQLRGMREPIGEGRGLLAARREGHDQAVPRRGMRQAGVPRGDVLRPRREAPGEVRLHLQVRGMHQAGGPGGGVRGARRDRPEPGPEVRRGGMRVEGAQGRDVRPARSRARAAMRPRGMCQQGEPSRRTLRKALQGEADGREVRTGQTEGGAGNGGRRSTCFVGQSRRKSRRRRQHRRESIYFAG